MPEYCRYCNHIRLLIIKSNHNYNYPKKDIVKSDEFFEKEKVNIDFKRGITIRKQNYCNKKLKVILDIYKCDINNKIILNKKLKKT